jgi:hypothetical protein
MNSSDTSQKYSCPGREQNQLIHVSAEVGVDDAAYGNSVGSECGVNGRMWMRMRREVANAPDVGRGGVTKKKNCTDCILLALRPPPSFRRPLHHR